MRKNEIYWLNLYKEGKIEINFETGDVYSYLSGNKYLLGTRRIGKRYLQSSAGPSKTERYHILLHRLIWIAANGEIVGNLQINHKNGIKHDNRLENLEVVTRAENALHSIRILGNKTGVLRGDKSNFAKLNWAEVDKIRFLFQNKKDTVKTLVKKYGIHKSQVYNIINNESWNEEYRENN